MSDSDGSGPDIDRLVDLQNEIDSVVAEIGERQRKRARYWVVALVAVFAATALIYASDFMGIPAEVAMLGATLIVLYSVGSAAWAEVSSIAFFTSAKERLEELTANLES
jgi:hypothetical protein